MKLFLKRRDFTMIGLAAGVQLVAGAAVMALLDPPLAISIVGALAVANVLAVGHYTYRKQQRDDYPLREPAGNYRQIEALFSLHAMLEFEHPLPPMRGFVISPDAGVALVDEVMRARAKAVVECGSGTSTVLIAQALKKLGGGHVWSLDNSAEYAQGTRDLLARHGLTAFATVVTAPLAPVETDAGTFDWYEPAKLGELPASIDVLFVDGPRDRGSDLARYPVIPVLAERFHPGTVVVIDDQLVPAVARSAERWAAKLPGHVLEVVPLEKGLGVLRPVAAADERRERATG